MMLAKWIEKSTSDDYSLKEIISTNIRISSLTHNKFSNKNQCTFKQTYKLNVMIVMF